MANDNRPSLTKPSSVKPVRALSNSFFIQLGSYAVFGLVMALLPQFAKSSTVTTVAQILIYSIAALGLNLLMGYSGLISLGTAGFMGLGAYLAAYLFSDMGLSFWIGLLVAIIVPTIIGVLVGLVSLRIAGLYLAIATLCVSEILLKTFEQFDTVTGGMRGKNIAYPPIFGMLNSGAKQKDLIYYFLIIVLVIVMALTWCLVNGQFGRALHAMRGSEAAAQAMGINLLKYRLIVFGMATAYAGLAGALYVFFVRSAYPTTWVLTLSLNLLAAVVIGGFRSIYGTVLGAFVVWAMSDLILKDLMKSLAALFPNVAFLSNPSNLAYMLTGILIILVVLFYPNGLINIFADIRNLFRKIFGKKTATTADGKGDVQDA